MLRLRPGAAVLLPGKPLTRYGAIWGRARERLAFSTPSRGAAFSVPPVQAHDQARR
jgi:hypothetical protein